jgi:hypothetical protein
MHCHILAFAFYLFCYHCPKLFSSTFVANSSIILHAQVVLIFCVHILNKVLILGWLLYLTFLAKAFFGHVYMLVIMVFYAVYASCIVHAAYVDFQ